MLRGWLREQPGQPSDPLFASRRGHRLSTDAVEWLVAKYATTAAQDCKSLRSKNVTPHTLRHYVDGWVMWPVGMFPLAAAPRGPVPAT